MVPVTKEVLQKAEEAAQRQRVLIEARSWLGTPFHHEAGVKGPRGGVDCAKFLIEVFSRAGVIEHFAVPHYPPDWHLHRDDERYLLTVLAHAQEVRWPCPGDLALFKFGRSFSHGAIVLAWPHQLINAHLLRGVVLVDPTLDAELMDRPTRFFSVWGRR
jgi:cell wall-associated NlpC family hydrolase